MLFIPFYVLNEEWINNVLDQEYRMKNVLNQEYRMKNVLNQECRRNNVTVNQECTGLSMRYNFSAATKYPRYSTSLGVTS